MELLDYIVLDVTRQNIEVIVDEYATGNLIEVFWQKDVCIVQGQNVNFNK